MSQSDAGANDLLSALYPSMRDEPANAKESDEAAMTSALLLAVQQKVEASLRVKTQFFEKNSEQLVRAASLISQSYQNGGRLLTAGNGGSACDAAHLAVEFMHPVTTGRPALAAINLSQDVTMMSAVANDVGFDQVLKRQLIAMAQPNDVLVVFSTSGNSNNLIAACNKAAEMGLSVIAFVGGNGGQMAKQGAISELLLVETDSVHRIQECHLMCYHILWDLVHSQLAETRGSRVK